MALFQGKNLTSSNLVLHLDATNTKALKEDIIKLNGGEVGDKNIYGALIKIIMITASGAEGISLSNVRYVHITEHCEK